MTFPLGNPTDDWAWERRRMQSAFVAYQLAKAGLTIDG